MRVPTADIDTIGVVVPARNEELRLSRCLTALTAATTMVRAMPGIAPRIEVIVVVDASTDGTARIARHWPGVEVVLTHASRVGAARRAGAGRLLQALTHAGMAARNAWIACTDADSAVPEDWLVTHLHHARTGVELLLGTVRPDPDELANGVLAAWRLRHLITDGHPHVHGANLGIRGDAYLAAGGFPDVEAHEDVLLGAAVRNAGGRVLSTGASPVLTSGRTHGRTPDGMAQYLGTLTDQQVPLQA